jgi:(E)-4-hydroxy-3-methylbut-2-enyl-diphosphate synthase
VEEIETALLGATVPIKIAVMGCVVNGPGEAREADIGVAGGDGTGVLFRRGKVVKKFPQDQLAAVLLKEVERFEKEHPTD